MMRFRKYVEDSLSVPVRECVFPALWMCDDTSRLHLQSARLSHAPMQLLLVARVLFVLFATSWMIVGLMIVVSASQLWVP